MKTNFRSVILLILTSLAFSLSAATVDSYFDNTGRDDVLSGGVKLIPIKTAKGTFNVWTKRVGNNPSIKVLLLHGGPGGTHELFETFDSYFPGASIEYYYYDQLGSFYSDHPNDPDLWTIEHFVDEVEQVRVALDLNKDNFYLYGQSWGGILAIEYALKYQRHLKGLVISNMMSSIPAYNEYASEVLMKTMDPTILAQIKQYEADKKYDDPRYMQLLVEHHYEHHVLRMPAKNWPEPVNRGFKHLNYPLYLHMQGPSELGAGGTLINWNRTADLEKITVPTLVIGAEFDTMDPKHMKMMSTKVKNGRYLYCPKGSHLAMYDDATTYINGLIKYFKDVDNGSFPD